MIKLKDILMYEGTRCWKGYEKKGMKTLFGKRVPNCVKKEAKLPDEGFSDPDDMRMYEDELGEDLRKWLKQKWVRMGPDGKIRGSCGGRKKGEGKPKCLPLAKARALGKKGRACCCSTKTKRRSKS